MASKKKSSKKASKRPTRKRKSTARLTVKKKSEPRHGCAAGKAQPKTRKKAKKKTKIGGRPKKKVLQVRTELLEPIPSLTLGSLRHPPNRDGLESYLAYFPSFDLLTAQEEVFFAKMAHRGEVLGRDRLIMHNIRLVAAETLRYFKGKTADDTQAVSVISEGVFGLIRAVERFDPDRGFRFSTYATHWIRRFIYRGSNGLRFIRLPHYIHGILARLGPTTAALREELGRDPLGKEVADRLGQREGAYRLAVQASGNTNIVHPVQTNACRPDGVHEDYLDTCNKCSKTVDPADALLASEAKELLLAALKKIDRRLATVVMMRYGVGFKRKSTLQEIGEKLSLSRERVRQLEAEGKDQLRIYLTEHGGTDL